MRGVGWDLCAQPESEWELDQDRKPQIAGAWRFHSLFDCGSIRSSFTFIPLGVDLDGFAVFSMGEEEMFEVTDFADSKAQPVTDGFLRELA